jgi:hypothetical protein
MGYEGTALFMDADMIVLDDIAELFALSNPDYGVQVAKVSRQFEWPSLMIFNCEKCQQLTPEYIDDERNNLFAMNWAKVGELPLEWNHTIGYDKPKEAKILHYTAGIPIFEETKKLGYVDEWKKAHSYANSTVSWEELMGNSVHREVIA